MADAAQLPRRGERRAAARAQNEEEGRRVRQRLDDVEVRMDGMQSRIDQHEMRLGYLEAHIKVVLRGFDAVPEFFRSRDGDFRLAKSAFIAAFMAELKENNGAEANASLAEAETLICDDNGLVVVGSFPHWWPSWPVSTCDSPPSADMGWFEALLSFGFGGQVFGGEPPDLHGSGSQTQGQRQREGRR